MKNKIVPITMLIISIILIGMGVFLGYIQNQKKLALMGSIITLKEEMFDKLTIEKTSNQRENITGTLKVNINIPQNQNEMAPSAIKYYQNISNLNINYIYNKDLVTKQISLAANTTLYNEPLINVLFYNDENDEGYIYSEKLYDKYIGLGKTNILSSIQQEDSEDIKYILTKLKESISNNIEDTEILKEKTTILIDEKKEKVSKISIKYDNKILTEKVSKIVDELYNDEKAREILKIKQENIENKNIEKILEDLKEFEYVIYKSNEKIIKYEINITNTQSTKTSLIYINKKLPEIIVSENNKVKYKVQIESTDKVLNMTFLNNKNETIGTFSQDEKSKNLDITHDTLNISLIEKKENNIFNTKLTISNIKSQVEKTDVITVYLDGTISENADFSNINVTNKKFYNELTEEEQNQISNNITSIFTKIFE